MLIEFADPRSAETAVGPRLALRGGHQMGQVGFDVGFDAGAGAFKMAQAFHLIGDELIVGRVLQGQEAFQEGDNRSGPCVPVGTSARVRTKAGLVAQEDGAQLVEPGAAHSEVARGGERVEASGVEVAEHPTDKISWKTMNELFLFTPLTCSARRARHQLSRCILGACPQTPGVFRIAAKGMIAPELRPRAGIMPTRDL